MMRAYSGVEFRRNDGREAGSKFRASGLLSGVSRVCLADSAEGIRLPRSVA